MINKKKRRERKEHYTIYEESNTSKTKEAKIRLWQNQIQTTNNSLINTDHRRNTGDDKMRKKLNQPKAEVFK
jgi:hypothetical protein